MRKIEEVIIDNDNVYLKKGKFGYRVVQPIKDSEDKSIMINVLIGGWENFFKLLFILFVVGCFLLGFSEITKSCKDMAEHPENYFDLKDPKGLGFLNVTWESDINYEEKG